MPSLKRAHDQDPEDSPTYSSASSAAGNSDDDDSGPETANTNGIGGREHYQPVSKSKLRERETAALGPQYAGSRVSRKGAGSEDEVGGHDPFAGIDEEESSPEGGDMDASEDGEESSEDELIDGEENEDTNATSISGDEDLNDDQASDLDQSDIEDDEDNLDAPTQSSRRAATSRAPETDRAQLRNLMNRTNTSIASSLHSANQADAEKGRAVKRQRQTYDQLLASRIQLQQGLLAANALPTRKEEQGEKEAVYQGAEEATLGLWNALNNLRERIHPSSGSKTADAKSKAFTATTSTPLTSLWDQMQQHENQAGSYRKSTLRKWSQKTAALASTTQTTSKNRLMGGDAAQPTVLDILETQYLAPNSVERLVERAQTRKPAVSANGASSETMNGDSQKTLQYDDSEFYASLLRDLIASRNAADGAPSAPAASRAPAETAEATLRAAQKAARTRRSNVDVKASKGRKMKYTVHEKLQNFMAPEDRGGWGQRQREELFGSLLGQMRRSSVSAPNDEDAVDGLNEDDRDVDRQEEALRLFRT